MSAQTAANDELLIQQFNDGNAAAFNELYQRHVSRVQRRVRFVVPEWDVEDVLQEVFLAAFRSLPTFRGEAQFGTWLRTLTNHKVAEYYRKRNRKQTAPQTPLHEAAGRADDHSAAVLEERIALNRALRELPEQYREVLLLRFAEGLQFNEISGLTGQSLEATKSLFRRAVSALRDRLDE
jgi:RNA polymerase sigma-70 factor (ECF subfamily)